ncbi:MAG: polysaccharide biosynthesis/export family protein, partial [Candidatus Eisenbacteria bacterium]
MRAAKFVGIIVLLQSAWGLGAPEGTTAGAAAGPTSSPAGETRPGPTWEAEATRSRPAARPAGLAEAIDPRSYSLAPGDRVAICIWGAVDVNLDLTVTADGALLIPSVGNLPVAGSTLAEAEEAVRSQAAQSYPHSRITLSLVEPALLRVPITGQVAHPGSYEILATSRLADLVAAAGDLNPGADGRALIVENGEGAREAHDFLAWQIDGLRTENPRLRSGDRVHVPPASAGFIVRGILEPHPATYSAGAVVDRPFPSASRRIPYREGDRVDFALRAAGGPGSGFCDTGIWLWRAGLEKIWIPLEQAQATPVAPGDVIEIPFCREWIAVSGEIRRAGYYPFLPGQTAADYVGLAGGPSSIGRDGGWKFIGDDGRMRDCAPADTVQAGARIWIPERRTHKISAFLAPLGTAAAVVFSLIALAS